MEIRKYAPSIVRYGSGIVFLLLGIDQIINTEYWTTYVPEWFNSFFPDAEKFMLANGIFDTVLGLILILGIYVRIFAIIAALHLIGVIITIGYGDIAVRDIGLLLAAVSVAVYGNDSLCLWPRKNY